MFAQFNWSPTFYGVKLQGQAKQLHYKRQSGAYPVNNLYFVNLDFTLLFFT